MGMGRVFEERARSLVLADEVRLGTLRDRRVEAAEDGAVSKVLAYVLSCHSRLHLVELSEARRVRVVDGRELVGDLVTEDEALVTRSDRVHSLQ